MEIIFNTDIRERVDQVIAKYNRMGENDDTLERFADAAVELLAVKPEYVNLIEDLVGYFEEVVDLMSMEPIMN